jgi:hypothetical protein
MEPFRTPVVLIIFNRPNTTAKVLSTIAQIRPQKLLVIADGPRSDRPGENEKCATSRTLIENVDWDCEISKNYSDVNLGCRQRVATGLNWVFTLVPEAIILEDDCVPNVTFFRYCTELLARYRHDEHIMMISGDNFQYGRRRSKYSYYFSKYLHIWGWATWRRAWQHYDDEMEAWPNIRDSGWLEKRSWLNARGVRHWQRLFQAVYENRINSWAHRWLLSGWSNDGLSILPNTNLVTNIGFGPEATHTKWQRSPLANMPVGSLTLPLQHPPTVGQHVAADRFTQNFVYSPSMLEKRRRGAAFHLRRLYERLKPEIN